jgi:ABC-type transport system involved in multi-copper enzyme maturation permease subunit
MIQAIKAEFRKLFSVRSTYILSGVAFALLALVAFYFEGYHLHGASLQDPNLMVEAVTGALDSPILIFGSICGILLITHEYRYNTILYTLTSSNSRTKILLAKVITMTIFGLVFTALVTVLSPLLGYLGIHMHGNTLIAQHIPYASLIWRSLVYGWGSFMLALLLGVLIRSQVGTFVALFVLPTIEITLTQLLKSKISVYFPFSSSSEIIEKPAFGTITYGRAALVFMAYLIVGWIVAWFLFLRRDAN